MSLMPPDLWSPPDHAFPDLSLLLSFSSPSHRPLVPHSYFLPLFTSPSSLFLQRVFPEGLFYACSTCWGTWSTQDKHTAYPPCSLENNDNSCDEYYGSEQGTCWEEGGSKSRWTPLWYSTYFLIISVFPRDICMYLFPQDTIISSQFWHSGHSPPPTRPGFCLSIVRDLPLPGSAACISLFHFLHCSVGRVSSHLCHLLGFRTLLAVFLQVFDAPILAFIAPSSSPQETPVRDDIHPTTQPRVICPFLFPRSYTHN